MNWAGSIRVVQIEKDGNAWTAAASGPIGSTSTPIFCKKWLE